jgi:WD40 repeat protein
MKKKMLLAGLTSLVCSFGIIFAEGESAKTTITADAPVADVCFSNDGKKLVFSYKNVISLYNVDGTLIKKFGVKDGPTIDVLDYANGVIAAFAYTNPAQIEIWDEKGVNTKKLGAIAKDADECSVNANIETAKSYRMLLTRDGKNLINTSTTDNFGGVKSRDIASGKLKVFKGYEDTSVYGCSLSPDGSKFVTISRCEQVKIWDIAKGTLVNSIDTGDPMNTSYYGKDVAFLADSTLAVVKQDLAIWSADGKQIKTIKKEVDSAYTLVRSSRDGSLFGVAFQDSGFAIYKKDGTLVKVIMTEGEYSLPCAVTGISFSPDNKSVAVSTDGGAMSKGDVRIYSL